MSLNFRDNQTDKKTPQAKNKANPVKQLFGAKKSSKKARKEKKKKSCQRWRKMSNPATRANAIQAIATGGEGQKKEKNSRYLQNHLL